MAEPARTDDLSDSAESLFGRGASATTPLVAGSSGSGSWAIPHLPRVRAPQYIAHRAHSAATDFVPSYTPTGNATIDGILAYVDAVTGGKAEWMRRLVTYLAIGAFGAVVNLVVFGLVAEKAHAPFLVAEIAASEISILTNFTLNDRLTFSRLPGHQRHWRDRCLRFHATAIGGTLLTISVSYLLFRFGAAKLVAQACAIIIALAFNFTFHHLFTYRHTSHVV